MDKLILALTQQLIDDRSRLKVLAERRTNPSGTNESEPETLQKRIEYLLEVRSKLEEMAAC